MGLFDLFRKKTPESRAGRPRPKKPKKDAADDKFVVPEGHEICTVAPVPFPGVFRTEGSVVVVSFGAASDEPDRELAFVRGKVEEALSDAASVARIVKPSGVLNLEELVYGADEPLFTIASPFVATFHVGVVPLLMASPARLQALLALFHHIASQRDPERPQAAYFVDAPSPATSLLAGWLRVLDVDVRIPDQNAIFAEVRRPDGSIEGMPLGAPHPTSLPDSDRYIWKVNAEKAHAASTGNAARKAKLEEEERAYLAEHVAKAGVKRGSTALVRSPKLTRILESVGTAEDKLAQMAELAGEILSREAPVVYLQEPDGGVQLRSSGPMERGIYVYPDITTARWAAEDLGRAPGTFTLAAAPGKAIFEVAAKDGIGVAVGAYRDRKTPIHALFTKELVRAVAGPSEGG